MAKRGLLAKIFHRSDPNDRDQLRIREENDQAKVFIEKQTKASILYGSYDMSYIYKSYDMSYSSYYSTSFRIKNLNRRKNIQSIQRKNEQIFSYINI